MYYAQLDENRICIAVSELIDEVQDDSMIKLEAFDTSLIGKKYDGKMWEYVPTVEPKKEEPAEKETEDPTKEIDTDLAVMETLAQIVEKQEENHRMIAESIASLFETMVDHKKTDEPDDTDAESLEYEEAVPM